MNKLMIMYFLMQAVTIFSQKYAFDYMLKSEVDNNGSKFQSFDLVNSENHNIYMEVGKNTTTSRFYAILLDKQRKLVHKFDLGQILTNPLKINYLDKYSFGKINFLKSDKWVLEKIADYKYKVFTDNISIKNKGYFEIELLLAPFEADLITINFEILSRNQESEVEQLVKEKLKSENLPGNFYIKEITYKYLKKMTYSSKITPEKYVINLDVSS